MRPGREFPTAAITTNRGPLRLAHTPQAGATAAARARADVRLRPDRLPAHPHRQRPPVRPLPLARALARAAGLRRDARRERHRHQRQDLRGRGAQGIGSAELAEQATRWYLEDTDALGLGRPDVEPLASETIPEIVALIEELVARGLAYESAGRRLLPRRALPGLRLALRREARGHGRAGAERPEGRPARLRALEGDEAERGHGLGLALGARPARLAHRVLRDGREAPRRRCSRSTAAGSTSASRTTRTSWRSRAAPGASSPALWMHNGMLELDEEKMSKSVGNIVSLREVAGRVRARGDPRLLPRRPLPQPDRVLRRGHALGAAEAERFRNAVPDAAAEREARRLGGLRGGPRRRFQHSGRAHRAPRLARGRPARPAASAGWRSSGWRASAAEESAPDEVVVAGRTRREEARGRRDFEEADRLRAGDRGRGWEVRDVAGRLPASLPIERDAGAGLRPPARARGRARRAGARSSSCWSTERALGRRRGSARPPASGSRSCASGA